MRSHLSEGRYFPGDGYFQDMVKAVKFYRYFRRVAVSEGRYFWNTLRDNPRERLRKR